MRVFSNRFIWAALLLAIFMQGCSSDKVNEAAYFKTFDHIKTDQFVWSYGHGGIYWVSGNEVVLDAQVKNTQGVFENGLYQVNVDDGSYIRLMERSNHYKYCFDGDVLFVRTKKEKQLLHMPENYRIVQETKAEKLKDGMYSPVRCKSLERPTKDGYRHLFQQDGLLKTDNNGLKYMGKDKRFKGHLDPDNKVHLVGENLSVKKILDLKISEVSTPYFLTHENAYFGYSMNGMCGSLWWLYRDTWKVQTKEQCFGSWAQFTSKLLYPTKAGVFVQHYTSKKYKSYLVTDKKEYTLETTSSIGGSLAPDGCRVAYGSGELSGKGGRRQILKLFNACQFMEEQEEK